MLRKGFPHGGNTVVGEACWLYLHMLWALYTYRSCTKSLLPHFVLILIWRSDIEDKEVSESVLKRVPAGQTEIPSRKIRDNAAVGVMFNCVRGIAAEAATTVTSLGGFLPTFSSEPTIPMSARQSSCDTMGDKVAQSCEYVL